MKESLPGVGGLLSVTGGIEAKSNSVIKKTFTRHVITAAHCRKEFTARGEPEYLYDDITVILGRETFFFYISLILTLIKGKHDISDKYERGTIESKIIDFRDHDLFFIRRGRGIIKYDITILTLEKPVDFKLYPFIR